MMVTPAAALRGGLHNSVDKATERPSMDFEKLIEAHGDRAYRFALSLSGNESDARDLVQEAFLKAFQKRDTFDPSRPFDAWLLRILKNLFVDGTRRYERRHGLSLDAPVSAEGKTWEALLPDRRPGPPDIVERRERNGRLRDALNALPLFYRTAVVLNDLEGLTYEQIAHVMNCPLGTVRSRIFKGRVLLKKSLAGVEMSEARP